MKKIINKAINPIRLFLNDSRCVGTILISCTIISLVIANSSGLGNVYRSFWQSEIPFKTPLNLPGSFSHWINDFLMAIFFLLAGMEIKRELLTGELASFKKAVLPFAAALGGMLVPALLFVAFNAHSGFIGGWGIPTATDIAFSLGIASLLGKKVPVGLRIFLMALAIIDDLGAIIVIALFYGGHVNWVFLAVSAGLYFLLMACNYFKVKFGFIQIMLSLALWYSIFNSGIEASITGVLVAFAMPKNILPKIEKVISNSVNFMILPLFALANTAILVPNDIIHSLSTSISVGIMFGLVLGKPIGIYLFSRLMVALKIAVLPKNISWNQIIGMGMLAGIGFTMSIFTTTLAYKTELNRDIAKISILLSMVLSLLISSVFFHFVLPKKVVLRAEEGSAKEQDVYIPSPTLEHAF